MTESSSYEKEAENWLRWTRTPGHDSYWFYASAFFDAVVPAAGRGTLEIGCGEGRVARDLLDRGHHVAAIDVSPTLLRSAREADRVSRYVLADAGHLPFADATFDLVVAYNSLMDVDDMAGAVRDAARVLEPGGRLCICVTHPMSDAGKFASDEPDAPFVIPGSYFGRRPFEETFDRDGLTMTFRGSRYRLEEYSRVLEAAGMMTELLREPPAGETAIARSASYRRWQRVPLFLHLRAVKRSHA